jgi:hypothetical protein
MFFFSSASYYQSVRLMLLILLRAFSSLARSFSFPFKDARQPREGFFVQLGARRILRFKFFYLGINLKIFSLGNCLRDAFLALSRCRAT